jgi:hypothetical protein
MATAATPGWKTSKDAKFRANIHYHNISLSAAWSDYLLIVELFSPNKIMNQGNPRYVSQHIKVFLTNLDMALAWFYRSFERRP